MQNYLETRSELAADADFINVLTSALKRIVLDRRALEELENAATLDIAVIRINSFIIVSLVHCDM